MYKRSNKPRPLDERLWEKVVKDHTDPNLKAGR